MKNRVILFITDSGFLVPTMNAVLQVCAQADVLHQADLLVFLIDMDEGEVIALKEAFAGLPVTFSKIPSSLFELPDDVHFNPTGVPRSTLARFSIGTLIPDRYEHVIYLDGDIQILGSLYRLVTHDVAPGFIAAANDAIWLARGDAGKFWQDSRRYLDGLAIDDPEDYFNAGVLLFRRETWISMAPAARDFFIRNSRLCSFHDQSALNATFKSRRERLSPAYNFISNYADAGIQRSFEPVIAHFTGPRKPWFYAGPPWNGRFIADYKELLNAYPVLAPYFRSPPQAQIARMTKIQKRRRLLYSLATPWRQILRRRRFRKYIQDTDFVVS